MEQMNNSEILLYQTEDGQTKIDVRLEEESVWISQAQMGELFQTTKQNISLHIKNIFDESELPENSTVKDYLTVQTEDKLQEKLVRANFAHTTQLVSICKSYSRFWYNRLISQLLNTIHSQILRQNKREL